MACEPRPPRECSWWRSRNREFPPEADAIALADVVVGSLYELTPEVVEAISP